jgi:hypothetical protein
MSTHRWLGLGLAGLLLLFAMSLIWHSLLAPAPSLPVVQLGAANGGGTVQVQAGQKVDLDLGAGYSAVHSSNAGVLVMGAIEPCLEVAGCQRYHFTAMSSGQADLQAERRAVCLPGDACPMFIFLFAIHVQVVPPQG